MRALAMLSPWGWPDMFRTVFLSLSVVIASVLAFTMPVLAGLSFTPGQTNDGLRFVMVTGDFAFADDLTQLVDIVRSHNPSVVSFDSPGGNIQKAFQLGRLVRSLNLNTVQLRSVECSSACSLAFFGGVIRYAEPGAIGVHKSSFSGDVPLDAHEAVSVVQQVTAEVITYMIEMGVDPALLQLSLQYDSDDIRYLSMSEMKKYRVVTLESGNPVPNFETQPPLFPPLTAPPPPAPPTVSSREPPAQTVSPFGLPTASSGLVRRPQGMAPLKALPNDQAATLVDLPNRSSVSIIGNFEHWYRVRADGHVGYLHDTWVYVDQFARSPFDRRRIQVRSFDNAAAAEAYVRSSPIPLSAYATTNGWFAVTLQDTYPLSAAKITVESMKQNGMIPDDSLVTFGNTYVAKVCCK